MMYYLQPNLQLPLMICAGRLLVLKVYTKFHVGLSDFLPIIIKSYIPTYFVSYTQWDETPFEGIFYNGNRTKVITK